MTILGNSRNGSSGGPHTITIVDPLTDIDNIIDHI